VFGPGPWSRVRAAFSNGSVVFVSVRPLLDADLVTRRVRVAKREVVFVKGIFEASEGLGALFAERGGDLVIAAPVSRSAELDELLADLALELGAIVEEDTAR
jgi:hypothetical protein